MSDQDAVSARLAKMVDDRLKEEFDKRDQMILKLKSGMDKLVETLREGNNNNSKNTLFFNFKSCHCVSYIIALSKVSKIKN